MDEVDEVYRREGLAVVTLDDSCENHRLALPNKLFHAVRAGIPVIAADLPELSRAITGRASARPTARGTSSLAAAVAEVAGRYDDALAAVAAVQERCRWERDAAVLAEAYDDLPRRTAEGSACGGAAPAAGPAR